MTSFFLHTMSINVSSKPWTWCYVLILSFSRFTRKKLSSCTINVTLWMVKCKRQAPEHTIRLEWRMAKWRVCEYANHARVLIWYGINRLRHSFDEDSYKWPCFCGIYQCPIHLKQPLFDHISSLTITKHREASSHFSDYTFLHSMIAILKEPKGGGLLKPHFQSSIHYNSYTFRNNPFCCTFLNPR